jgi:hypothetical protein
MLTKNLLTISLLLPLAAISATAYAGETITSKSYWPSEARQSAARDYRYCIQGDAFAGGAGDCSFASYQQCLDRVRPHGLLQSESLVPERCASRKSNSHMVNSRADAWPRYQGGPKSR